MGDEARTPTGPSAIAVAPPGRATILTWLTSPAFRSLALIPLLVMAFVSAGRADGLSVASLRQSLEGSGAAGPLVFAGLYGVAATALLPAAPFTVAAGVLFGPVTGTLTALLGAAIGATGAFLVGRGLGRRSVERFGGRRVAWLDRYLARRGFAAVLVVRLVPLFPFNLVNLVAGVTGLRLRDYVLATVVGIIPGTVADAALGGTIDDPTSPAFIGALVLFVVVTLALVPPRGASDAARS